MGSFSGSFKCFLKNFNSIKPRSSLLTPNYLSSRSFSEQKKGVNLYTSRSHTCGELSKEDVGKHVTLSGWLEFRRMNKFGILRDAYGTTQIVIPEERKELMKLLDETPLESVVSVEGTVAERPGNQVNKKMSTGEVELIVSEYKLINPVTKQLPFSVREFNKSKESLRLKYRYLDLRYPEAQRRLRARSELLFKMREFLVREAAFVEVETPALFKATPGGAQEFLVPTRFPGEFYSLAQSPQQSKQLLMVGGTDRYFQVAKCFRDETARPDRQPEFTQLDLELSFTSCDGVMSLVEDLLAWSWPGGPPTPLPFPRMPYAEAIQFYGTDKPDLRIDAKIGNLDDLLPEANSDSSLVFPAKWKDITARGFRVPKGSGLFVGDLKRSVLGLKRER